jgi:hypothetical protein
MALKYPPHCENNRHEQSRIDCWGILEQHWNGAKLVDTKTMLEWAKSMTWKGIKPVFTLCRKTYEKG